MSLSITKIQSITILSVDLLKEYLIVCPTIARESITCERVSEESHPYIDILSCRRDALYGHAALLSEVNMISPFLLHLSEHFIL
jgi:hypothetical protein